MDIAALPELEGRMGVLELLSTVLAFSAPVAVVSGYIPIVITYDGVAAPGIYLIAMVLLLLFATGFTTMSRYLPKSGAFYTYITAGLGPVVGLGAAALALFGYLMLGFSNLPFFGINASLLVSETLRGPAIPWYWYMLACGLGCGVLSYFRIDLSAKVLSLAMVLEVLVVLVFDLSVLRNGGPEGISLQPFSFGAIRSGAVGISILFAATCFFGFEATAIFRDEVAEPNKTIPRATYLAVLLIGLFYVFAAWMLVSAYGISSAAKVAQSELPTMYSAAMRHFVGQAGVDVTRVLLVSSLFAGALSGQNILARYLFNLGRDGALPTILGRAHPRHHSPYVASMFVSALWAMLWLTFITLGTDPVKLYERVAGVGGFAVLILILLTSVAVVVFFKRSSHIEDSTAWHTVIAPVTSAIALAIVLYLAIENFPLLIDGSTTDGWLLQLVTWGTLFGGMVLALVYRRSRPIVYRRIGHQGA